MKEELAELWRYRQLLKMLVARELKVRYKNSFLGFFWSIIPPLMQVAVFSFLYRGVLGLPAKNLSAYLLTGIIPWSFFSSCILDASQSIVVNYTMIRKIYLPREAIPLAIVISNTVHFILGWVVYFAAFLVVAHFFNVGIPLVPSMVFFPFLVILEVILVTGISLYVAALNVFYEDVKFLLSTIFGLAIFILPVLYPADQIYYTSHLVRNHKWIFELYMLNPIASIIDAFRHCLLQSISPSNFNAKLKHAHALPFNPYVFTCSTVITLLIFWGGLTYFNKRKWQFVERP